MWVHPLELELAGELGEQWEEVTDNVLDEKLGLVKLELLFE